jgi:hypothetical protein
LNLPENAILLWVALSPHESPVNSHNFWYTLQILSLYLWNSKWQIVSQIFNCINISKSQLPRMSKLHSLISLLPRYLCWH